MKNEFWKHESELKFFWSIAIIFSFAFTIMGIILIVADVSYWPILLCGLILLLSCFYALFIEKRTLSKVQFTDKTIILKRLNKVLTSIDWTQLTQVKASSCSWGTFYLLFIAEDKQIDIVLTKKIYNAIMLICPYPQIKAEINQIEQFKHFHNRQN